MPDTRWAATPRLDPERLVRAFDEPPGVEGAGPGGEVGAAYVRWPDDRRGVLTSTTAQGVRMAGLARAAGLPAPRVQAAAATDGGHVMVADVLPGRPPATVDRNLVDQMLALNRRMAGLLDGYDELPPPRLHLCASGPGFCRHEPLEGYDRRTRRLLARIREIGQERDTADGDDLVHLDFHPGNVLVDNGRISGLVDWDGAGRGDGGLDLVTLRFDLALRAPALGAALEERIRADVPADRLRAYWAHMSLRLVDWAIRHHGSGDVDRWVAVARTGLD